jgi:hypothetical protein
MNAYHRGLLATLYLAHDELRRIPEEEWNDDQFYNRSDATSNLFGHFVRTLTQHNTESPHAINAREYMLAAGPLSSAINEILDLILPHNVWDAYAIASGRSAEFNDPNPYKRAMKLFEFIEKKYPRHLHSDAKTIIPDPLEKPLEGAAFSS